MLVRGALCRLAADLPKTSAHDLSQLARALQRNFVRRNALSVPVVNVLSRAYRRSYATTRSTQPTATVKKAVKKAVAKKPAVSKKATVTKTKKKTAAKKPKAKKAVKPKKAKKVVTPEEKQKKQIAELKRKALRSPVTPGVVSAWQIFTKETFEAKKPISEAASRYRNLSAAEKEHYNHLANEKTKSKQAEYRAWIHSHTPEEIRIANLARAQLRRKIADNFKRVPTYFVEIKDDRAPKRPAGAYLLFYSERYSSGDLKNISTGDGAKLVGNEWKALTAGEKKKYEDEAKTLKEKYDRDYERVFGHKSGQEA